MVGIDVSEPGHRRPAGLACRQAEAGATPGDGVGGSGRGSSRAIAEQRTNVRDGRDGTWRDGGGGGGGDCGLTAGADGSRAREGSGAELFQVCRVAWVGHEDDRELVCRGKRRVSGHRVWVARDECVEVTTLVAPRRGWRGGGCWQTDSGRQGVRSLWQGVRARHRWGIGGAGRGGPAHWKLGSVQVPSRR